MLGLIEVESACKYAISRAGARGYMQVMCRSGRGSSAMGSDKLFHLQPICAMAASSCATTCSASAATCLALGRYNGSRRAAIRTQACRPAPLAFGRAAGRPASRTWACFASLQGGE